MKKFLLITVFAFCGINYSVAQSIDYDKAMDEIMSNHIDDYPEASIRAINKLFEGVNINSLPAETQFFYYYYLGGCYSEANRDDDAIQYFTEAREIASSNREVGIRNAYALDAEGQLADLYMSKNTEESRALALLLYNDIITVGVSLIVNPDIGLFVVQALIEEAKAGVAMWKDPEWVKKIWIQARDLAIEINDSTTYSYYVLNVLNYYCDLGEYDTALNFIEDAKNKEILTLDASSHCDWINKIKNYIALRDELKKSKGLTSMDYWSNEFWIAGASVVLCSNEVAIKMLQDVEIGLKHNNLTNSYEYAQTIHLLADLTMDTPAVCEPYLIEQVNIMSNTPQYYYNIVADVQIYNALGICQMNLGKYRDADTNLKKALACLERDIASADLPGYKQILLTVYHNIGRNLYYLEEYKTSIEYYNKSIELQENMTEFALPKTKIYLAESLEYINIK